MGKTIKLDKYTPRPYQLNLVEAILNKGYKNALAVWPRRAGKDITVWQICIDIALSKTCDSLTTSRRKLLLR